MKCACDCSNIPCRPVPRPRASLRAPPLRTPRWRDATLARSLFQLARNRVTSANGKISSRVPGKRTTTRANARTRSRCASRSSRHGTPFGSLVRRRSPRETSVAFRTPALQSDEKSETRCSRSPPWRTVPSWAAPCTTPRRAAPSASRRFPPRSRGSPCACAGRTAARFTRSSSRSSPPEVRRASPVREFPNAFPEGASRPQSLRLSPADARTLSAFLLRRRVQGFLRLRGDQAGHQGVRRPRRRQARGVLCRVWLRRRQGHRALRQIRGDRTQDEEEMRETRGEGEENAAPAAW